MSESSPRPWRVSDSDPAVVYDADGNVVCVTALTPDQRPPAIIANAALIVAAVNGLFDPSLISVRPGMKWLVPGSPPIAGDCARPLEHAAGCECGGL